MNRAAAWRFLVVAAFLAYAVYLWNDLPNTTVNGTFADTTFAIDLAEPDRSAQLRLTRAPMLEIGPLSSDRLTATVRVGLRSADDNTHAVHVVAQVPAHGRLVAVTVVADGLVRERVAPPWPGLLVRDLVVPGGDPERSTLIRIPVGVGPQSTVVSVSTEVDRERISDRETPLGIYSFSARLCPTDFVAMHNAVALPAAPHVHNGGPEVRVGLGSLRLRNTLAVTDQARSQETTAVWTQPPSGAAPFIRAQGAAENRTARFGVQLFTVVFGLVMGAWLGVTLDRTLLTAKS